AARTARRRRRGEDSRASRRAACRADRRCRRRRAEHARRRPRAGLRWLLAHRRRCIRRARQACARSCRRRCDRRLPVPRHARRRGAAIASAGSRGVRHALDGTGTNRRMKRRAALFAIGACAAAFATPLFAADTPASDVTAPVRAFYDALLDVMKRTKALGIKGRYDRLAPVIEQTFDLPAMTRIAVGPRWTSIPKDQQAALVDAFSRMTIATYASRFDGFSGERFEVDSDVDARGSGSVVHTRIVPPKG